MDTLTALVLLAYLYPPGRTADDRWEVRWEAARVLRRMARDAR